MRLLPILAVAWTLSCLASGTTENDPLSGSQTMTALDLFKASTTNLNGTDLYSSGVLFYAAEIRARTDDDCYPPKDTGGDSPMVLLGALREEIGEQVNVDLPKDPAILARVVERLKDWDPSVASGYEPGWGYSSACNDYAARARDHKEKALRPMADLSMLLLIPEYKSAFDVEQAFNMTSYEDRKKPDRIKAVKDAETTILRIEKEKGVDVLSSMLANKQHS